MMMMMMMMMMIVMILTDSHDDKQTKLEKNRYMTQTCASSSSLQLLNLPGEAKETNQILTPDDSKMNPFPRNTMYTDDQKGT